MEDHPVWARDGRKRWYLAIGRIRGILKACRDRQKQELPEAIVIQNRLAEARVRIQADPSEENTKLFEDTLAMGRRREQVDARICTIRSRIKWLREGDSPSKYFFAFLKAKQSQETLSALRLESGETITGESEIQELLVGAYRALYTAEQELEEVIHMRADALQLIDKTLSQDQNRQLGEIPSEELIEDIVKSLPKDKSPGIDGVTAELLVAGWSFMRTDCFAMVWRVWASRKLLHRDNRGIIDIQQMGFIAGRSIVENVLSLRLAQDWVQCTGQEIVFVKLDFQKAYDMVSHSYLWATLAALGVCQENVQRIQCLVTGGSSEVQVNGVLTEGFSVTRGVRQGCPMAPPLFAMVTQPFMRMLREEEKEGRLQGVTYGGQQTLLHQIYADDTCIHITMKEEQFNRLTEVIHSYELISGAKLNLSKSLIMPLGPGRNPAWLHETGCEIAGEGKNFIYLGVSTSNPINEKEITKSIVKKIENKLNHWSNRLLSWPGRILLLQHVLAATPVYQLLSVGLENTGLEALERLCSQFLWGWREDKSPKASLIA
ncbi:hypothetical protein R1sor_019816 [Riccia sorocarpa]|uniref:Reverse transcriptase domain-containing protein n=1 Tax=Riccia sorocarpa TaxID=122646 RepID=A0ABD3IJT6_9MARC